MISLPVTMSVQAGHTQRSQSQASIAAALAEEKRLRKLADDDALRLYNRIGQLQKEEERADRRIKETKQKAASIQKQQQRLLERQSEKAAREAALKAQLERQFQENQKLKQEHERTRQQVESQMLAEKASTAAVTKEQRAERAAALEQLQANALAAVQAKKEAVRQQHLTGATKLQQYKATKQVMAHQEYERRLQEQLEVKQQKEQEIAELVQLELQLVERLKLKQQQQVSAARKLESAVAMRQSIRRSQQLPTQRLSGSVYSSRPSSRPATSNSKTTAAVSCPEPGKQARSVAADEVVARAFSKYDDMATGLISVHAIPGLLKDLGMPLTGNSLVMAVAQLDSQQAGTVSFGQFLLWWKE